MKPAERSDQALPDEVVAESLGRFAAYQRFPAFSWPWWWRRGKVFWPFAALTGVGYGAWHAASMNAWSDFPSLAWRAILGAEIMVTVGPLLATAARHRKLPYTIERMLVLAAIVVGLAIAAAAGRWVGHYHDALMVRYHSGGMDAPAVMNSLGQAAGDLLGMAPRWFILFCIGGGLELFAYFTERRRLADHQRRRALESLQGEKHAADMRLAVLQAQIEPHFLFNTLASLRSLVRAAPERAEATIDGFADYLRSTLPKLRAPGSERATLGEQLDICLRYLDLVNIRMDGRLSVAVHVADELKGLSFPPFILIPLVENAIKHGIEPKTGPGRVILRAAMHETPGGDMLEIAVEDDGAGLSSGFGAGVGLANVRAQLQHRFGERASLSIKGVPQGGVRAAITLPASEA